MLERLNNVKVEKNPRLRDEIIGRTVEISLIGCVKVGYALAYVV